jgi:signal transduction histidine kinase
MAKRVYSVEELQSGVNLDYPQNSLVVDVAAISSRTFPEQFQYSFSVLSQDGRVVHKKRSALALLAVWWGYRQNHKLFGANVQLADTRMQLANETETERRRIARDLHDQTLADLRRLMMMTDRLPTLESSNGHVEPSTFRNEIEAISTEIRRICEDLSPSTLANVGLAAALEWALADSVAHQPPERRFVYEFRCDAQIEERLRLEPTAQIQIYRIVQEVLSNVCRHSSANRVRLEVTVSDNRELLIQIEDNGSGFDSTSTGKSGRGLNNIRSRASLIEASVGWSARTGGGTMFTLRKPTVAPSG